MSSYGVLSTGFVDKSVEDILTDVQDEQKNLLGGKFDVSTHSPVGQLNGIWAAALRELWEVAQAVYASIDVDQASGETLTVLAALTGTIRRAATKSTVTATVNLDGGVTLPVGSIAFVSGSPTVRFVTTAAATNSGGSPANVSVAMEAETAGAVVASSGTLTEIATPVTGWNSVTNALDATIGEEAETDSDLKARRLTELSLGGSGTLNAIIAGVQQVDGLTNLQVEQNDTDTAVGGLAAHSIRVTALGGTDDDIAQAIFDNKGAGTTAQGATSGTATDILNNSYTVAFSRPTQTPMYVEVTVTKNSDPAAGSVWDAVNGPTDVKEAIVAYAQANWDIGDDAILAQLYAPILGVSGVTDITSLEVDNVTPTVATGNYTAATGELLEFDTSRITVT